MNLSDDALRLIRGLLVAKIGELEHQFQGVVTVDPLAEATRVNAKMMTERLRDALKTVNAECRRRWL